ncbi:MAG TPA: hypothetical protein VN973_00805 [Candidatus Dormibacteraeota bacterium]|nr:hypothetical protein [Candidatus Dormibacteraeota bacterium]
MWRRALILILGFPLLLAACQPAAQTVPSVSPQVASARPAPNRLPVSDALISTSDTRSYLLFQLPGEDHLRGVSWDGATSGVIAGQVGAQAIWSAQAPDGSRYIADSVVYDRQGHSLGAIPWPDKGYSGSWSSDGKLLCDAVPESPTTGALMRLDVAALGHAPRVVTRAYAIYSDNATYPVLACDTTRDRAIVAVLGQGIALGHIWVFRLSNGTLIRSIDSPGSWAAVSNDGALLAVAQPTSSGATRTTIQRTDDGTTVGTVDNFTAHGFSSNGSLLVGTTDPDSTVLLDWRTGRRIWSHSGLPYGGFFAEPAGERVAIGLGFTGGSDIADVYIVALDGSAVLLPAHVRAALQF